MNTVSEQTMKCLVWKVGRKQMGCWVAIEHWAVFSWFWQWSWFLDFNFKNWTSLLYCIPVCSLSLISSTLYNFQIFERFLPLGQFRTDQYGVEPLFAFVSYRMCMMILYFLSSSKTMENTSGWIKDSLVG